jgi:hypothetical protein
VQKRKFQFILRVGGAVAITLWFGVAGALAGLGCFYLFPAQYRSTGRVVVSDGDGAPGEPVARASALAQTARSPATLSTAILVADLYHSDRHRVPFTDLAGKLSFTADVRPVSRGAVVDVAMTYADREKVQRALDSVIRHMVSEDAPRFAKLGAFAMNSRNASAGVRTGGLEPGISLPAGFIAGLLVHGIYAQLRMRRPALNLSVRRIRIGERGGDIDG